MQVSYKIAVTIVYIKRVNWWSEEGNRVTSSLDNYMHTYMHCITISSGADYWVSVISETCKPLITRGNVVPQ